MNAIVQDVRYALRRLAKSPGFTLLAVLTLALGIGLNSAVFSVVNAVVLKPLPVEDPDELVSWYSDSLGGTFTHGPIAFPDYLDIREQSRSYEDLAAYNLSGMIFEEEGGEATFIMGELATGNYFSMLGVQPHRGRLLDVRDDDSNNPQPVTVLSHRTWQRRFGGDPSVVGSTVRLNGHAFTVVGVAQKDFMGFMKGLAPEVWVPMHMMTTMRAGSITNSGDPTPGLERIEDRARSWHWMIGRLRDGVTIEEARSEVGMIQTRLQETYPETNENRAYLLERTSSIKVMPGVDGPIHFGAMVIMGLVSLVLLIACSNVANMLLARAVERRKEIATRLALGASRGALLRQLLAENLVLSFLGGGLGLGLALVSNTVVDSMKLPLPVDLALGLTLDLRVLGFTFVVATLTALLFGMAPALDATRTNLTTALRDEARGSSGGVAKRRLRSGLVVAEVALSFVLLVCAGLSVRSMQNAQHIDPGFRSDGLVTAGFTPEVHGYERQGAFDLYESMRARLEALPEASGVTFASHLPLSMNMSMERVALPGQEALPYDEWPSVDTAWVAPGYFETLEIPVLSGRALSQQDFTDERPVVLVNQAFAERFFGNESPIGQRLHLNENGDTLEIIGVAATSKYRTLGEEARPFLFQSLRQSNSTAWAVVAASNGDPSAAMAAVRQVAKELDEKIAVGRLATVEDTIGSSLIMPKLSAALFSVFGGIGALLAMVGIYGVVSYMVSQRTHEIGIRMAMGARRRDILVLVSRDGLGLVAIGLALGVGLSILVTRALDAVLYGVSATDAMTFVGVGLLLTGVALLASLMPARRAAGVHPMVALRWE